MSERDEWKMGVSQCIVALILQSSPCGDLNQSFFKTKHK